MTKTKDVQEQVEEILQEQIALLRRRAKECARQFNHQIYDDLTAQYIVLEKKLKTLVAPNPAPPISYSPEGNHCSICDLYDQWCEHIKSPVAGSPTERAATMPAILGAPYDLKNAVPLDDPYHRGGLWEYTKAEPSVEVVPVLTLEETIHCSGTNEACVAPKLNWTRSRQSS